MSEEEAAQLLAEVRAETERTHRAQAEMQAAADARTAAVRAAMEAGLPRDAIAEAAGTARANLYRIFNRK